MSDREQLQKQISELLKFDPNSVARTEQLGELSFKPLVPVFTDMQRLVKQVASSDLDGLPDEWINLIVGQFGQFDKAIKEVADFTVGGAGDPAARRSEVISFVKQTAANMFLKLPAVISYGLASAHNRDFGQLAAKKAEVDELARRLTDLLAKGQEERGKITVSQHAQHFRSEAWLHAFLSVVWALVVIGLALATIWYAVTHVAVVGGTGMTLPDVLARILPKLIVVSVLSSATVFVAKNFRASQHNFVVNRHRMRALSTFDAFVDASDVQTKQAVLLQAAGAIFAPQSSGFGGPDSDGGGQPNMIEIVKIANQTKP